MPYPNGLPLDIIWDEIAYELDSPKDLLSLALTSRIFKDQIIPSHLEYRDICCDLRRESVWKFLANHPRLARGIRSVELVNERFLWDSHATVRLPQILENILFDYWSEDYGAPTTDENITMFRDSLSHMTFLRKFIWQQQCTSIQKIIDVFHVLTHRTRCLETFSVNLYGFRDRPSDELQLNNPTIWSLTGLTKLVVRRPNIAAIQMLDLCPEIEDLNLWELPSNSTVYLMQHVNLQKLRRLSLMTISPDPFIPDISMIAIPFFDYNSQAAAVVPKNRIDSQETLIEALLKCSKLTHALCDFELHGSTCLNPHETLEPFSKRLSALQTLEYFSVILGHYEEQRFVELERSEGGQYSGYRFVTVKEVGKDPEC
ncbi:hypothetical protein Clacol_007052 [Clathrus columnatus]|uniref:F-box domain-containing protein n=1 Tax=Clathrus columnatus TaxID=1419009 RepID=A0AAV5AGQ0_9AGAM|nr:hypothetical protein Clacol_007052 [Clathrus columnatus]